MPAANREVKKLKIDGPPVDADREIETLRVCMKALAKLQPKEARRVIRYLDNRWPDPDIDEG